MMRTSVYQNYGTAGGSGTYSKFSALSDLLPHLSNVLFFNFFTASTPDTDAGQHQNPLDFFDEKSLRGPVYGAALWAGWWQPAPIPGPSYDADEANSSESLKVAVEEFIPARTTAGTAVSGAVAYTFSVFGGSFSYQSTLGTPQPLDPRIDSWWFIGTAYNLRFNNHNNFLRDYLPVKLELWSALTGGTETEYNLTYSTWSQFTNGNVSFDALNIPSNDRVTASDLTKNINIELVSNKQVTLTSSGCGSSCTVLRSTTTGDIVEVVYVANLNTQLSAYV